MDFILKFWKNVLIFGIIDALKIEKYERLHDLWTFYEIKSSFYNENSNNDSIRITVKPLTFKLDQKITRTIS